MKQQNNALETQVFARHNAPFIGSVTETGSFKQQDLADPGFGVEMVHRRQRLLNRDGSFNVKRTGARFLESQSLYHFAMNVSWGRFFLSLSAVYLAVNLLFASLYYLCGPDAISGMEGVSGGARFLRDFFFSIQTFATIGYGVIHPVTVVANLIVTAEAFTGLLLVAMATGLFFARLSSPGAKILFSRQAVISPYTSGKALMFRAVNQRANELFDLNARLSLGWLEPDGGQMKRRFYELPLERSHVMFFPLNWTVVHPITEDSPLWGISPQQLADRDAEFLVFINGIDDTFNQPVYTWTSYRFDEIVWNAKFVNMLEVADNGDLTIDLSRTHDTEPAAA